MRGRVQAVSGRGFGASVSLGSSSERVEGRMEDLIGDQFGRQQALEDEAFGQDVYNAHELFGRHGEILFLRDRTKPFRPEGITLGSERGNLRPQFLMRERIGQAREAPDGGGAAIGDGGQGGVGQGAHDFGESRALPYLRLDRGPVGLAERDQ